MSTREYDRYGRDPELKAFYQGQRWRKVRDMKLQRDPLCEACAQAGRTTVAVLVHHLLPVKEHWEQRYNLDFMVSICHPCHNAIESELDAAKVLK